MVSPREGEHLIDLSHMMSATTKHWYALYTRSRHEKKVDRQLAGRGVESYLPQRKVLRQWSDRKKWIEEPLFRCYIFVRMDHSDRLAVLKVPGVTRVVSFQGKPAVVRDEEIETIRRVLQEMPEAESCPQVHVGDEVEVMGGPLIGIRGRLEAIQNQKRVVVSVDSIHQAFRFVVENQNIRIIKND